MVRLRGIPLFAELKDLDLRPHPPHGVAMHRAAQRVKSELDIGIWPAHRKPVRTAQLRSAVACFCRRLVNSASGLQPAC